MRPDSYLHDTCIRLPEHAHQFTPDRSGKGRGPSTLRMGRNKRRQEDDRIWRERPGGRTPHWHRHRHTAMYATHLSRFCAVLIGHGGEKKQTCITLLNDVSFPSQMSLDECGEPGSKLRLNGSGLSAQKTPKTIHGN